MRNQFIARIGAVGIALAWMSLTTLPVAGQATKTAAKSALPRTPDGHPDLQGTYDLATMTPFERLPGDPSFFTKEQAEAHEKAEAERRSQTKGHLATPSAGGGTSAPISFFEALERAGGGAVGGY